LELTGERPRLSISPFDIVFAALPVRIASLTTSPLNNLIPLNENVNIQKGYLSALAHDAANGIAPPPTRPSGALVHHTRPMPA
jgi:hypothetical protein